MWVVLLCLLLAAAGDKLAEDSASFLSLGRLESQFPSPRCCHSADCISRSRGRHAFLTTLRTEEYLILLRELHCSIRKHYHTIDFIVGAVAGDLSRETVREIESFANYTEFPEFSFPNRHSARFSKNWVKLQAWGLEQYDAIIMLDADGLVLANLDHLFQLPTDFAWTYEQGARYYYNYGSFMLLRPCKAVMMHMMTMVKHHPSLTFPDSDAEQDFLRFYFSHSGMQLPSIYSSNYHEYLSTEEKAPGGGTALYLHFGYEAKPFELDPNAPEWKYMCHRVRPSRRWKWPFFAKSHTKQL